LSPYTNTPNIDLCLPYRGECLGEEEEGGKFIANVYILDFFLSLSPDGNKSARLSLEGRKKERSSYSPLTKYYTSSSFFLSPTGRCGKEGKSSIPITRCRSQMHLGPPDSRNLQRSRNWQRCRKKKEKENLQTCRSPPPRLYYGQLDKLVARGGGAVSGVRQSLCDNNLFISKKKQLMASIVRKGKRKKGVCRSRAC